MERCSPLNRPAESLFYSPGIAGSGKNVKISLVTCLACVFASQGEPDLPLTEPFEAPKYGVSTRLPRDWTLAVREKDDRVFVAVIPQDDPNRPGIAACELGVAPQSLEEYRTRIDSSAKQRAGRGGKLVTNRLIKD